MDLFKKFLNKNTNNNNQNNSQQNNNNNQNQDQENNELSTSSELNNPLKNIILSNTLKEEYKYAENTKQNLEEIFIRLQKFNKIKTQMNEELQLLANSFDKFSNSISDNKPIFGHLKLMSDYLSKMSNSSQKLDEEITKNVSKPIFDILNVNMLQADYFKKKMNEITEKCDQMSKKMDKPQKDVNKRNEMMEDTNELMDKRQSMEDSTILKVKEINERNEIQLISILRNFEGINNEHFEFMKNTTSIQDKMSLPYHNYACQVQDTHNSGRSTEKITLEQYFSKNPPKKISNSI